MKINIRKLISIIISLLMITSSSAGPAAVGVCQAGCAAVVVACYAAAGSIFGTITTGASTPAVILACNSAFGFCVKMCFMLLFTPTP